MKRECVICGPQGEQIEATVEGGTIQINGVKVVQADIEACNGRLFSE